MRTVDVDARTDAGAKSALRPLDLPRHELHGNGEVPVELHDDGRPVAGAPPVNLRGSGVVERHDNVGRQGADGDFRRQARARQVQPRNDVGNRDAGFDVSADQPVDEAPQPIGTRPVLSR